MKKTIIVLAIGLLVFSLAQCNLFTTTIGYEVTSSDTSSFHIYYTSDVSDLTEVTTDTSWTKSVDQVEHPGYEARLHPGYKIHWRPISRLRSRSTARR